MGWRSVHDIRRALMFGRARARRVISLVRASILTTLARKHVAMCFRARVVRMPRVGSQSSSSIQRPPRAADSDEGGFDSATPFPNLHILHQFQIPQARGGRNQNNTSVWKLEASLTSQERVGGPTHRDGELLHRFWDGLASCVARVSVFIHAPSLVLALHHRCADRRRKWCTKLPLPLAGEVPTAQDAEAASSLLPVRMFHGINFTSFSGGRGCEGAKGELNAKTVD